MKEKIFYKFLIEFSKAPERIKLARDDNRLTLTEKLILDGYLKIRNNQNNAVLEMMKGTGPSPLTFVESQRLLLLGSASNNLSKFEEAEKYLHGSIEILKNIHAPYFCFFAQFTLFWIYANLNQVSKMEQVLKAMELIPIESDHQQMRLWRCQFCYHQMADNFDVVQIVMAKIEGSINELSESDIISYYVDKFSFCIQIDNFNEAYQVLAAMKKYRKFNLNENYNYMKKLLDHFVKDVPIYAYEDEFAKIPILLFQIKVIQALEEKKLEVANHYWAQLNSLSAGTYQDDFNYVGSKCLFSICLNKNIQKIVDPSSIKLNQDSTKFASLVKLFQENKAPLPAALIYELLWGAPPRDKEDLKKISRLVSRVKKERQMNITYRKGTYELRESVTKKSA